jgi:hypothetical protein
MDFGGQLHAAVALPPGKEPLLSTECCENTHCLSRQLNPDLPTRSPLLYRFLRKKKFVTLLGYLIKAFVTKVFLV